MSADAAVILFRSDGLSPGSLAKAGQVTVTCGFNSRLSISNSPP